MQGVIWTCIMSAALALMAALSLWGVLPPLHSTLPVLGAQELTLWKRIDGTLLCIASGAYLPVCVYLISRRPRKEIVRMNVRASRSKTLQAAE